MSSEINLIGSHGNVDGASAEHRRGISDQRSISPSLRTHAETIEERTISLRAVIGGLLIGAMICFANLYFLLQAGLNNSMPLPSALLGYIVFQPISKYLRTPYSPMENVLVMTIAASMGAMPVTAGLDGIIPALEYLITPRDNGPIKFSLWHLIIWSSGVCLFGIVFAAPLRYIFILRNPLRFPTGTAMAMVIGLLHKRPDIAERISRDQSQEKANHDMKFTEPSSAIERQGEIPSDDDQLIQVNNESNNFIAEGNGLGEGYQASLTHRGKLMISFSLSALSALILYFVPSITKLPIFGIPAARDWAWAFNPSPAWVGYGMIIRPMVSAHMLLGAVIGWGILSPIAKKRGWAPGPVDQWQDGSQGWIIWIALAVLLGDSIIGIGWILLRPLVIKPAEGDNLVRRLSYKFIKHCSACFSTRESPNSRNILESQFHEPQECTPLLASENEAQATSDSLLQPLDDAPPAHRLSNITSLYWLAAVSLFCFYTTWYLFGNLLSILQIALAITVIPPLGIASIRSMGETDNSLASSLGKVSQFLFALVIPRSNPNAIIISLLVGGIAEGGVYQSSDVMQHFKTGHLVGASPKALFYGQVIGSSVGAVLASCVYRLYTSVYTIPNEQFRVPQAQLWLATANLIYGRGLPEGVLPFVVVAFALSVISAISRIALAGWRWRDHIPGGIAVGIGLYILPAYTLPQAVGGLVAWYCRHRLRMEELAIITVASGLILGVGVTNIVNLLLSLMNVPHF